MHKNNLLQYKSLSLFRALLTRATVRWGLKSSSERACELGSIAPRNVLTRRAASERVDDDASSHPIQTTEIRCSLGKVPTFLKCTSGVAGFGTLPSSASTMLRLCASLISPRKRTVKWRMFGLTSFRSAPVA